MTESEVNLVSLRQAAATVNEWLVSWVGDRFLAGTPTLDSAAETWQVPILYILPKEGPLGVVGEVIVDALTGELCHLPAADEVKQQALSL
ncbi:MAG TPA: hypothetical protein VFD58_02970 [Blastocatellia bacterium]|nr:hypothetical protein [Blastocatellia bacterium]